MELQKSQQSILEKQTFRSQFKTSNAGISQGSVLGPLLFLLYINDLPRASDHKCIQFADNTTLIMKYKNKATYNTDLTKALTDLKS